jgi:hypothetical protein
MNETVNLTFSIVYMLTTVKDICFIDRIVEHKKIELVYEFSQTLPNKY